MPSFAPDRTLVLALIDAAVRAPSADNRHHVRFAIDDGGLTIRSDAEHLACAERHRRLLTLLSFGAVVENLRLALTRHGYSFEPRWYPDANDPALLLRIDWSTLTPVASTDPLADAIETRHTNRRFYRGPSMSAAERATLDDAAARIAGARLRWFDAGDPRRDLLRLVRLAETERFRSPVLHAEMFESIDFSAGWAEPTAERLAPATLEVEPFMRAGFGALRRPGVMRAARRVGLHRVLGLRAGEIPARTASHLGVMTASDPSELGALPVGAAFERLWLAAERAGLALQPMVASAILATQSHANEGASDAVRSALAAGWRHLVGDDTPLVVFRLGRARRPAVVSGRRAAEDYVL